MIEVLLAACLLALVLIGGLLYTMHDRIRTKLRDFEKRFVQADLQKQWRHTASLLALYRIMDGKDWLPEIQGTELPPDLLLGVISHIQKRPPRVILECGAGISTVLMAHALDRMGTTSHIYSIEEHPHLADETLKELQRRKLDQHVTIFNVPLVEHSYPEQDSSLLWFDLNGISLPNEIDLLLLAGPRSAEAKHLHFPAGVELLPRLSPGAHVFVANPERPNDLKTQWRRLYPNLGVIEHRPEMNALEMYFLDHKIREFLPEGGEKIPTT